MICCSTGSSLSLDPARCRRVMTTSDASPRSSRPVAATAASVAGEEADDNVKAGDDAVDDGHDDASNAVDHSHDGLTDRPEDGSDL